MEKPNKIHDDGKNYAYIDKVGIMHVTDEKVSGEKNSANGKIIETPMLCSGGYANINGEEIIVYSETDMRLSADGKPLDTPIPELAELYSKLK